MAVLTMILDGVVNQLSTGGHVFSGSVVWNPGVPHQKQDYHIMYLLCISICIIMYIICNMYLYMYRIGGFCTRLVPSRHRAQLMSD